MKCGGQYWYVIYYNMGVLAYGGLQAKREKERVAYII